MQTAVKQMVKNPDGPFVRVLRQRLRANNGFCPNKLGKKSDNKCPCRDYREERICACGMYIAATAHEIQNQ